MLIIPAIDILDGQCVRLTQGDYSAKKIYFPDPLQVAQEFTKLGAELLHLVDLNGAKSGSPVNEKLIMKIIKTVNIPVQIGGGIRTKETATKYLNAGAKRIILGSSALSNLGLVEDLVNQYGAERIVVSLDAKKGFLASEGWEKSSKIKLFDLAEILKEIGIKNIVFTDILKDGTLTTPNFAVIKKLSQQDFAVIASGGISDLNSILKLQKIGASAAIVGKAFYEKKLPWSILQSSLAKRIIPCLDVKNGRVVKGVNFANLRDSGDPVKLARYYAKQGADELVFLDISASQEARSTRGELVKKISREIFIPFTVGGGISSLKEAQDLFLAGADKISLNTQAVKNPALITQCANSFGSQAVVVAIDVKKVADKYKVFIKAGSEETAWEALAWAQEVQRLGAGEILLTSMDCDGTKQGFDVELVKLISSQVKIPVIASGGAGSLQDLVDVLQAGQADAVLAASIFHEKKFTVKEVKKFLLSNNLMARL